MRNQIKNAIKKIPGLSRRLRLIRRYFQGKQNLPNWSHIKFSGNSKKSGPKRVLIATSTGANLAASLVESTLGVALKLREAKVSALLCDSTLSACQECHLSWFKDGEHFIKGGPQKAGLCQACFGPAEKSFLSAGIECFRYSQFISDSDLSEINKIVGTTPADQIPSFRWQDLAIGEHALAGALRFFATAELTNESNGEAVLRRYFKASLQTAFAVSHLLEQNEFDVAVFSHGIYVPHGIVGECCRKNNVRVVNWNPGYRSRTFIFSHDDTYHHTMMTEANSEWENMEFSPSTQKELDDYLKSRWVGKNDWIWFHENPVLEVESITKELGLDPKKKSIGLLTSVMWDAQLHYPTNIFKGMKDWVIDTIKYFEKRPELQLIIRIHPAEIRGTLPSRQPMLAEIEKAFPRLASNIIIIPPESPLSTYAAMGLCDSVIIYNTKTGVELSAGGIPTIVAGEAWIRAKGFAYDPKSYEEYFKILDQLPLGKKMSPELTERAKKYAYHFFFRRMIELKIFEKKPNAWPPYELVSHNSEILKPGHCQGLDIICDGILEGRPFVFPAESNQKISQTAA